MKKNITLYLQLVCSFTIILLLEGAAVFCQNPLKDRADAIDARYSSLQPVVAYKIIIDSNDLTSYSVEMHIRNVPGTFRVAMVTE